jgi:(2Fe-2S) ferredoxin
MGQYNCHVFVCTFGDWCKHDGDTEAIVRHFKQAAIRAGLQGRVRINKAGCLNQCGHGPMVVFYPQDRWYAGVTPEDVADLVESEMLQGKPLLRLLYHALPGDNKDLSHYPPELIASERAKTGDG